jgi:hypothetical protein
VFASSEMIAFSGRSAPMTAGQSKLNGLVGSGTWPGGFPNEVIEGPQRLTLLGKIPAALGFLTTGISLYTSGP